MNVPDELIETGRNAVAKLYRTMPQDKVPLLREQVATILEAVLPKIRADERAKVAEEIEPILKDLRKAARTHHYLIACEGTDAALARLRAQIRSES